VRVIVDEGHRMKGGDLFDRATSFIIELDSIYKQIHTESIRFGVSQANAIGAPLPGLRADLTGRSLGSGPEYAEQ
jgi:hypothetical protein